MSVIGAAAATFLFRGCQRKKRVSGKKILVGCSCQTAGSCGRKAEVTGSSAEDRKCRERHKGATGGVGGAEGQKGPRVSNH